MRSAPRRLSLCLAIVGALVSACARREVATTAAIVAAPAARPPPPPSALRVLVGGDVLPHRPRLLPAERIAGALAPLRPLFDEADATIVNY
jgi:hypothetical protein